MVETGSPAPDFTLVGTDFKPRKLSEWRGRRLVLAFYPGAFTGVCKKEMCTLRDDIAKLEKLNAQVVGVSVNDPFSQKAFADDNALNFPLLCDYNREAARLYGVELPDFAGLKGYTAAKRSVFLIDSEGVLRWKWVSDDPRVEPPYEELKRRLSDL